MIAKGKVIAAIAIIQMISLLSNSVDSTFIGFKIAVMPKTDAILKIFDLLNSLRK